MSLLHRCAIPTIVSETRREKLVLEHKVAMSNKSHYYQQEQQQQQQQQQRQAAAAKASSRSMVIVKSNECDKVKGFYYNYSFNMYYNIA